MKKIGLICAVALAGMSLAACGNQSTKKASSPSKVSSSKVVKHHKRQNKKKQNTSSSNAVSTSSEKASSQTQQQASSQRKFNKSDPSTWHDIPYKGYPSYDAYCEANGGDPEVQAETASMQHAENVRRGIEDANGNETQNFQNWVSARDNAWDNGNDNFPDYDQNTQW
ncbi:hypothetical protein HUK49_06885 [Limosilactobacillus sp. c11Ua_112_M]|uniref:hypothetical protein n=1 Tax=Limosilactobacillus portuensis TaxID=2742601 RepID=UPI00177AE709|nr:hypothetical protein [Limosilactobacillus portuensis]MBD8087665.1 hypothetical protein [Limosilactobacillus portuensis]